MGSPIRPEPDDPIERYRRKYLTTGTDTAKAPAVRPDMSRVASTDDPVDAYLKKYMTDAAADLRPGMAEKIGLGLVGIAAAPVESAVNTIAPTKEAAAAAEADPQFQARMVARFGREAKPRGVSGPERFNAALQTGANMAAPGLVRLFPRAGVTAAGALTGAAYDPENRTRGAAMGGGLGFAMQAAPFLGGKALDLTGTRPRSYTGTPTLGTAVADASDALSPGLATRNINNPPPPNVGRRLLKSAAQAVGVESHEQQAVAMIARAMERDGLSLQQAATKAAGQFGMEPNTLMELAGRNTMRLGRSTLTAPGAGSEMMASRIGERALGEEDRLIEALLASGGNQGRMNIPRTITALSDEANTAATPLYDALRAMGERDMPAVADYINRPAFKAAYKHMEQVAANQGKKLPPLFEDVTDEAGKVVGQKMRKLDFESVDRVKRGIDEVLYDAERPLPSELAREAGGLSKTGHSAIEVAQKEFLGLAEQAFPGYGSARDAFAGPTAIKRAVQRGEKASSMTPDEIAEYKGTVGTSEREAFKRSALESFIQNRIEGTMPGSDVTRTVAKTRDKKRLAAIFDSPEEMRAFGESAAEMSRRFRTRNFLGAQSQTADKLAELAELADISLDDMADLAMGNTGGILKKTASKLGAKMQRGRTEATAEAVAKRLTAGATPEPGMMSLQDVLDEIKAYGEQQGGRSARKVVKSAAAGLSPSQASKP